MRSTDAGVRVELADGDTLEADSLVVAAGAWSGRLLAPLGLARSPSTRTVDGETWQGATGSDVIRWG